MDDIKTFYQSAEVLCLNRLRDALDPETALFSRQLRNRKWEATLGTEEVTSTAICLIGAARAGVDPETIHLDVSRTLDALVHAGRRHAYQGCTGLVIWANAAVDGPPLAGLLQRLNASLGETGSLLDRITTMETAWLVSGLARELERSPSAAVKTALASAAAGLLDRFNHGSGLFHHSSRKAPLRPRCRRHLPNFADQIYSVQALAHAASPLQMEQALEAAELCASRLTELQGDRGQWWWHYDSSKGRVAQPFPVYSVHQHAMAPMALMSLKAAGGKDYTDVIGRSLAWLGDNELGVDLLDRQAGTIWRDIEVKEGRLGRLRRQAGELLGLETSPGEVPAGRLTVNCETRPYEWGWCIYAGAVARETAAGSAS